MLGESPRGLAFGSKLLVASRVGCSLWLKASRESCNGLQLCRYQDFAKDVGRAVLGRRLALLGPVGQCAPAHSVHVLDCFRWRSLFLLCQEEAGGGFESKEALPNPFVSAETLKACALIGLHILSAEGEAGSTDNQSPDEGDMWRRDCPKSLEWISSCKRNLLWW